MSYSIEQLKVVYKAAKQGLRFDDVLKFIELLDADSSAPEKSTETGVTKAGRKAAKVKGAKAKSPKAKGAKKSSRNNSRTQQILNHLLQAGEKGSHVNDIAKAVGSTVGGISTWFYTTGKKLVASKEVKKVAPNTFVYLPKKSVKATA